MVKLAGSVGVGGRNARPDVALMQMALRHLGRFGGLVDGRFSSSLKTAMRIHFGGVDVRVAPGSKDLMLLSRSLPQDLRQARAWKQTPYLFVQDAVRPQTGWPRQHAALPDKEYEQLHRAIWRVDVVRQLSLVVMDVAVDAHGHFLVRLAFEGVRFIDPLTGRIARKIPQAIMASIRNDIPVSGWEALHGETLVFRTRRRWPALQQSREVTLDQLTMLGLKVRPSSAVLRRCSAAVARHLLDGNELDSEHRELIQCFGVSRLTVEQKVELRARDCASQTRKWRKTLARLHELHDSLLSIGDAYMTAWYERVGLLAEGRARTSESFSIVLHQIGFVDTVATVLDLIKGDKPPAEISKTIVSGADAVQGAIDFLDDIGARTSRDIVRAFNVVSLAQATQKTFSNAVQNTKDLFRIDALREAMQAMWISFYNGFAELEALWPEQKSILTALHALKCPVAVDEMERLWSDLFSLHLALFSHPPILDNNAYRRLKNVRGKENSVLKAG